MWTTVACLVALNLTPGQSGGLALTNVRTTYGILGPPRTGDRFLPGDALVLSFDLKGAKVDAGGKVHYSVGMEVTDAKGKVQFRQLPRPLEADAPPAGQDLPAFASVQIGLDQPP